MRPELPLLGSNGQYSRFPLARFAEEMRRLGITGLDFVPQTPHMFCSHTGCGATAEVLRALEGLRVETVTPPPYRYSITAPDGTQRWATLAYYTRCLELAKKLGGWGMVLSAAGACWDIPAARLEDHAAQMLTLLCGVAARLGLKLLLAPSMGADTPLIAEAPVLGRAEELARMLARVHSPSLLAVLDTNVMSSRGETIDLWFGTLGKQIGLVRLCDGNYHGYRAWGEGCLPMERYYAEIKSAGYSGFFSLYLPGERYLGVPAHPDKRALEAMGGGEARV